MAVKLTVRFLNNFIIDIVRTVLDDETGKLKTETKQFHIQLGDTYDIDQFERYQDDKLDLHFPEGSPLEGIALRVEGDHCAINEPPIPKVNPGGCGGCGGGKKK